MKVAEELWLSVPEMLFLAARRRLKPPKIMEHQVFNIVFTSIFVFSERLQLRS